VNDQRDHVATIDAAKQEGIEEGIEKGRKERDHEIAQALLKQGLSIEQIAEATSLSVEEITSLKK
jgi:predicted transposase/invertase (TIGR01784 family)